MRTLFRPDAPIPTLVDAGVAGKKRNSHREQFEADGTVPQTFDDHWNNPDVRGWLHAMQAHVCAYCGLEDRTLDVEHFRPKGAIHGEPPGTPGYWWLAYEASNLFLACTACNQKRKGTRFPLAAANPRVAYGTRLLLEQEERILLDPVEDTPVEDWFHLNWTDPTCQLLPAPGLDAIRQRRVEDVIDFFNLNMDATVRTRRSKAYESAVRAANQNQWGEVRCAAMRHREHSFVARFVLIQLKKELPTPEEELEDLVLVLWQDLLEQVKWILDLGNRGKEPAPQDVRQMKSYTWALTVLQSHGSLAQTQLVENLLAARLGAEPIGAIRFQIVRLFRELASP